MAGEDDAGLHARRVNALLERMKKEGGEEERWKRPEDAGPYPREWDRFQGLKPMADGRVPTFWIRDLTPDMADQVVEHMMRHYIREEVMAATLGVADDPLAIVEWEAIWRAVIANYPVSLAAFTDWPDGEERLVGLNVMSVTQQDDPSLKAECERNRPGFQLYKEVIKEADVFNKYGVRSYLAGLGLSVPRDFRGQGLGLRLLRARDPLCAALRIPLTVTAFSGAQSQKQAQRAGFEVLTSRRYADFTMDGGKRPFKDAPWTHLEIQGKFYGPREDQQQ